MRRPPLIERLRALQPDQGMALTSEDAQALLREMEAWNAVADRAREAEGKIAMLSEGDCICCHGTGAIQDGAKCSTCDGTGAHGSLARARLLRAMTGVDAVGSTERLEARFVVCSKCEGEGRWDVSLGGYDPRDGSLLTEERVCHVCRGSGHVEESPEPRTHDDMEAASAPAQEDGSKDLGAHPRGSGQNAGGVEIAGRLRCLADIAQDAPDGWTRLNAAARELVRQSAYEVDRLEKTSGQSEAVLRELASSLGVGGYNDAGEPFDPEKYGPKIIDGIDDANCADARGLAPLPETPVDRRRAERNAASPEGARSGRDQPRQVAGRIS